jgi:hypothetical protein
MKIQSPSPVLSLFLIPLLVGLPLNAQLPPSGPAPALQVRFIESPTNADVAFNVEVIDAKGLPVANAAVAFRLPDSGATGTFTDGSHAAVIYSDAAGHARSPAVSWGSTPGSANLRITVVKGDLHAGLLVEGIAATPAAVVKKDATKDTVSRTPSRSVVVVKSPPTPGTLASSAPKPAVSGASPAPAPPASLEPTVSIVTVPNSRPHSNKKWLIIAIVAVGAGVGAAVALKGKGTPAATIGTPSVSVGASH